MATEITTVKPRKGIPKFFKSATLSRTIKDPSGRERKEQGKGYDKEKFPMSRQMFRPRYSSSRGRWLLGGFAGAVDNPDVAEEFNKLVKSCRFKFPKGHPKEGQYIEEAYIFDPTDPFFNHKKLQILATEGEVAFRSDNPVHKIILEALKEDPDFSTPDISGSMLSSRIKYVLSNKELDTKQKAAKLKKEDEVYDLFKSLDYSKKKKVARAMQIPIAEDIDPTDLDIILREKAKDTNKMRGGASYQDTFIEICKLDDENLNTLDMIHKAKKLGIIRSKREGFEFFGNFIGKNMDSVEKYFQNKENGDLILRLERALEDAESTKHGN